MPTAVDEGIEADGGFDQLAFEPASQGLDRRRTGRYWRRACVGWTGKAVYSGLSLHWCAEWAQYAVDVSPSPSQPTPERAPGRADKTDLRDQITGLVLPESEPVSVSIPRIGVRSKLVPLGLKRGVMETPRPADVGWYSRGPSPGALGPAVIAGHVTWNGPAVFYRLGTMRRGDQVSVTRKDGKTAVFTVTRVTQFSKSRFPTRAVYGPIDHAGLRLITCGGTYDKARSRYLDNVVVFAKLQAVHPG